MDVAYGRGEQLRNGGTSKMVGAYDFESTIGKGHFAVVKQARHVFTGEKVAVKVFDKHKLDSSSTVNLLHEIRCMKLVRHPNIVRLYEVIDTQSKIYLILELGDYDLYEYMTRKAPAGLSERRARRYFCQILEAIAFCHHHHVVHRDLKAENVVFFEKLDLVKLTDFGLSHLFVPGQPLRTSCGSLAYSAPEILLGNSYDAPAVDIWSLGVILFMLVCGGLPFQGVSDSETLTKIMDCNFQLPDRLSSDCKELICKMLVRDPNVRLKLSNIRCLDWLKKDGSSSSTSVLEEVHLVHFNHLAEEVAQSIVQQMVDGGVGEKEQINQALERDEYNHLTATYYLLAERALKNLRLKHKENAKSMSEAPVINCPNGGASSCLEFSMRKRHCSTVAEESEDDASSVAMSLCSCNLSLSRNSSVLSSRRQSASLLLSTNSMMMSTTVARFHDMALQLDTGDGRSASFTGLEYQLIKLQRNMSFPMLIEQQRSSSFMPNNCSSYGGGSFLCRKRAVFNKTTSMGLCNRLTKLRTRSCGAISI